MEIVVTSAEMRACDRYAIEKLKIPGLILMENAGRSVVERMEKHYGSLSGKSVIVFCGKGNNGGDGFVVARHLYNRGANVLIIIVGRAREIKGDARVNYETIKKMTQSLPKNDIRLSRIEVTSAKKLNKLPQANFLVDALFGTGFSGAGRGVYKDVIEKMNTLEGTRISIDIPSGVNADNGVVENVAVKANLTVTMGLKKIGLIIGKGKEHAGAVEVADISMPREVIEKTASQTFIISVEDVRGVLPKRSFDAHKHSVGKIFVLAGSRGLTGAAAMTSSSAMKAGAGAVILGTPSSVYPILAKKLTEVMVEPLDETSEGSVSLSAYEQIQKHVRWADVVIVGPGLSRDSETQQLVWKIVSTIDKPLLIDADGLNALAENILVLKRHKSKDVIITPHTGELSRLIGLPSEDIERNRVEIARTVAEQFKLTLVLKGAPTVTASERGEVYINSTGNPGMATAGSGDVLAGLIGGLWAQGMTRTDAAYAGVFIHGLAGDMARDTYGEKSLMAMDIQSYLPEAIQRVERSVGAT
ncbi:MAG: NAD(P)H-hydrate dehydratase [Ignavibacteriae bacterium]|nr:NAD(P)H-hydrate dehydratase [Ignavibacteriota bacterium]